MKQKLLLTILLFSIYTGVFAQNTPIINVYAYSQAVLQGAKPSGTIEEGGKEIKTVAQWVKYTKNPKYCLHVNGYWDRNLQGVLYCNTCGAPRPVLKLQHNT